MKRIKKVFALYTSLHGSLFRYSLSFCLLLALLPTLMIGIILFQNLVFDINQFTQFLYYYLPEDLLEPFIQYVMEKEHSITHIVFPFLSAVYLASRSFYSFLLISASHEQFHTFHFLLRIKAFFLFVRFVLTLIILYVFLSLTLFDVFMVFMIGLFISFYLLYRSLSFEKRPLSYGIVGSGFSVIGILTTGRLFLWIIDVFTSYKSVYGPLGSLLILLLSIYIISCIIYFGYCLNLEFGNKYPEKNYKSAWFFKKGETIISYLKNVGE